MGFLSKLFSKPPEIEKAELFPEYALSFVKQTKESLRGSNRTVNLFLLEGEFNYLSMIVALAAADYASIINFGGVTAQQEKVLGKLIKSFERYNPHVRKNLIFHKHFLDSMDTEGRLRADGMTIPQASGCWILMTLIGQNSIDLDNPEILEAGRIIGDWIYDEFTHYWDGCIV